MPSRRDSFKAGMAVLSAIMASDAGAAAEFSATFRMPEEGERHERTWMAYVARKEIWSRRQIPEVKNNLIAIAKVISKYEPVTMLVAPEDLHDAASRLTGHSSRYPVSLIEFRTDDLWLRDTGPTFVVDGQRKKVAVDFNFNGWGNKQAHGNDKKVASYIASIRNVSLIRSSLVLEGGCFEVDGHGTAIMTKSCIANENRNPTVSLQEIESELKHLLGLRKIIWLEGIVGHDITDAHTDFYARFARTGLVLVSQDNYRGSPDYELTRENIDILRHSTDADGNTLQLEIIDTPDVVNENFGIKDFAAGYIGYYLCNGAVIAQKFGDNYADKRAADVLRACYPDRNLEQLAIDGIAAGGGSIHCATQQEFYI